MKGGLWRRIKTVALTDISVLVRGIDRDTLEQVEKALLDADFGPIAFELAGELEARVRQGELRTEEAVRSWLAGEIAALAGVPARDGELNLGARSSPAVILMLGVNGVGKTTQTAKLAHRLITRGTSVLLAVADTFRAAAAEQMRVWAGRLGVPVVTGFKEAIRLRWRSMPSRQRRRGTQTPFSLTPRAGSTRKMI